MLRSLLAIISNTFTETLRQPIYGVVIAVAAILLTFSPSLVMFTLDDDNQLLKDIGLSTLLVAGLFLAVFAAATVVTDEIENKTVLTVITKAVSRSTFIVGKFLGIAAAVILAQFLLSLILLMVIRHGVLEADSDQHDTVVITLASAGAGLVFLIGLVGNYFYRWRFSSTAVLLGSIFASIIIGLLYFIDPYWNFNPANNNLHFQLAAPIILTYIATIILTAIAVAAATRLGLIMTLIVCSFAFILGAMIQYWLGPITTQSGITSYLAWVPLAVVPSINIFVVTNAIYEGYSIPLIYIGHTTLYALFYVVGALLFAIALFRQREIG